MCIYRASYGTTKYCTFYLRGQTCQNPSCMYLHEPGEEIESKEDLLRYDYFWCMIIYYYFFS